jgi:hypothetical protein
MDTLAFDPKEITYSTGMNETLSFDLSELVTEYGGTGVVNPTATLVDLSNPSIEIPIGSNPIASDAMTVQLDLNGSILIPQHRYRLVIGCTASPSTNVGEQYFEIYVKF